MKAATFKTQTSGGRTTLGDCITTALRPHRVLVTLWVPQHVLHLTRRIGSQNE
jgi:hypothetical protein